MDIKSILDFGCFGVLAWIVWFVFSKALPAFITALETQRREFLVALEKQAKEHKDELQKERNMVADQTQVLANLTDVITRHDKDMRRAHDIESAREVQRIIEAAISKQFPRHTQDVHVTNTPTDPVPTTHAT